MFSGAESPFAVIDASFEFRGTHTEFSVLHRQLSKPPDANAQ